MKKNSSRGRLGCSPSFIICGLPLRGNSCYTGTCTQHSWQSSMKLRTPKANLQSIHAMRLQQENRITIKVQWMNDLQDFIHNLGMNILPMDEWLEPLPWCLGILDSFKEVENHTIIYPSWGLGICHALFPFYFELLLRNE